MYIFTTIVFVVFVLLSWSAIGIISVFLGEIIGVRPGGLILGILGLLSIKLSWDLALKITNRKSQRLNDKEK